MISPYQFVFEITAIGYTIFDSTHLWKQRRLKNTLISVFDYKKLQSLNFGDSTVYLANAPESMIKDLIPYNLFKDIYNNKTSPEIAWDALSKEAPMYLVLGILNKIYDLRYYDEQEEIETSEETLEKNYTYFLNGLDNAFHCAKRFCEYPNGISGINNMRVSLSFDGDNYSMRYNSVTLTGFICFDIMNILKNHISIKKCKNCGKYFIPQNRADEIYCTNIYQNGKTCKEVGYSQSVKNDSFKSAYRSAYKTQRARIKYNSHIPDYEEKHVIPWVAAAKEAMIEYSSKNDIEGFKKWLKNNKDSF